MVCCLLYKIPCVTSFASNRGLCMEQLLPFIQPNILFADFYQFTMAQLYFCNGLHARKVRFDYFFRSYPDYGAHKAGYCIFAGLEWLIARIQTVRFENRNLDCLRNCASSIGKALFREDFLAWLIS